MIDEQRLRTILQTEANRHSVNPILGTSAIAKARWSRVTHFAGASAVVAAIAFLGVGVLAQVDADTRRIDPAAGAAGSANAIASGTTPGGATWTLSSAPASQWTTSTAEGFGDEGAHCFGLSAGADNGKSATCHARPDNIDKWLHLESTRLAENGRGAGAALYGEVSKRVKSIEITLASGRVLTADVIDAADAPYTYFVTFLDAEAEGNVAAYDDNEKLVMRSDFMLERGGLTDDTQ